jgi:hypothetical protein
MMASGRMLGRITVLRVSTVRPVLKLKRNWPGDTPGRRILMITDTLFKWDGWNAPSDEVWTFHDCTLKVPIGPFKAGDVVPAILIDFEHGYIQLIRDPAYTEVRGNDLIHEQKIRLALVD